RQRLRLARQVVDDGWSVAAAASYFRVSWRTAQRWARRYVEMGMLDRSSLAHSSPNKTLRTLVRKVVHLRWKKRLGPVGIGAGPTPRSAATHPSAD
ncbi:leucine zipper domain-containing protein, partial [uncultured Microbacterium sp.]|uniref:helix-turn-helix domain-containing protein n=1 Tax=uncultured Microbacterium sp. TaxID=191216 RepID=UPI0025E01FB0